MVTVNQDLKVMHGGVGLKWSDRVLGRASCALKLDGVGGVLIDASY
jgi:hypothetical protein